MNNAAKLNFTDREQTRSYFLPIKYMFLIFRVNITVKTAKRLGNCAFASGRGSCETASEREREREREAEAAQISNLCFSPPLSPASFVFFICDTSELYKVLQEEHAAFQISSTTSSLQPKPYPTIVTVPIRAYEIGLRGTNQDSRPSVISVVKSRHYRLRETHPGASIFTCS